STAIRHPDADHIQAGTSLFALQDVQAQVFCGRGCALRFFAYGDEFLCLEGGGGGKRADPGGTNPDVCPGSGSVSRTAEVSRAGWRRDSAPVGHAAASGFLGGIPPGGHPGGDHRCRKAGNGGGERTVSGTGSPGGAPECADLRHEGGAGKARGSGERQDRKSTRLNSSHVKISYAV